MDPLSSSKRAILGTVWRLLPVGKRARQVLPPTSPQLTPAFVQGSLLAEIFLAESKGPSGQEVARAFRVGLGLPRCRPRNYASVRTANVAQFSALSFTD